METVWPQHFSVDAVRPGFGSKLCGYTIALEAWRRGLTVTFTDSALRTYTISDDQGRSVRFVRSSPHMTTRKAVRIANDKYATHATLRTAGVPTPEARIFDMKHDSTVQILEAADEFGYPVVVKPAAGRMGRGVFANIADADELLDRLTYLTETLEHRRILLETHVQGEDHRVLVVGSRIAGICKRVPANITGNGESSVDELIEAKNALRKMNPFLSKGLIKKDYETRNWLARANLDYDSVPTAGQYIRLRSAANASAGGDVVAVDLPEKVKSAAIAAAHAIPDLFCAGVDVLYTAQQDTADPVFAILELNAHPQIGVNMYPTHGVGSEAPKVIIDECFPNSERVHSAHLLDVSFRTRELLTPLTSGVAQSVTLAKIPSHEWSVRREVVFQKAFRLKNEQRLKLQRLAQKYHVAGHLDTTMETPRLRIAGETERIQEIVNLIGVPTFQDNPWEGVVTLGFKIT